MSRNPLQGHNVQNALIILGGIKNYYANFDLASPALWKDTIPLTGTASFSSIFDAAIGVENTTNIYNLDDEFLLIAVFEALLEYTALSLHHKKSNRALEFLLKYNDDNRYVTCEISLHWKLHWNIKDKMYPYRTLKQGASFMALLRFLFNLSRMDALATLANILDMRFENLYQLSGDKHSAELKGNSHYVEDLPEVLQLKHFSAGTTNAELVKVVEILGNRNQVIGAVAVYRLGHSTFCLPATVGRGVLSLGCCKPTAYFLNQHLMDEHPQATIVFCQDMRTALALQRILDETRGYNPAEIIVTAHLGEDLSVLPWSYLYGHDVVFVCAPTKHCMAMVKAYDAYVRGARAKSFRVHLGFLLHSPPGCGLEAEVVGVTDTEAGLLHKAVWLDTVERPTWLIAQMVKNAVSYEEYLAWGRALGIFKMPKGHEHAEVIASSDDLVLFTPNAEEVAPQPTSIKDVTAQHIFPLHRNVLLHGLKDAGKSLIGLSIAKTVVCGDPLFGRFPSDGDSNVMYINSETPEADFTQRVTQFDLVEKLGQRLFVLSKYEHAATDCAFSLTDAIFCKKVAALLQKNSCRYLILDNLTSLMDNGQAIQAIAVSKVYAWVETLQQRGVCVILLHHSKDDAKAGTSSAKPRGCQDSSIRGHSEIVLISSTQILEQKLGPESVQIAAAQDGLTVGVLFKVCKSAAVLQKKTIWLHLPLGTAEWQRMAVTDALGKLVEQHPDTEGAKGDGLPCAQGEQAATLTAIPLTVLRPEYEVGNTATPSPDLLTDCTDDERKVYEFIRKRGRIKNVDVQNLLNCAGTKAGGIFNSLIAKELIKREESGPATCYRLLQE